MLDSALVMDRWRRISRGWITPMCASAALAISTLAAAGEPEQTQILYNAQVFTAEYDHPYAEAVAIRGDRILAVGSLQSVEQAA